jgi:hypothetical protein
MRKLLTFLIALGAIVFAVVSPAWAQSPVLPGFPPGVFQNHSVYDPPPGGGTPFGITYIGDNSNTTAGATFTFTSQAIGTADPTRIVAVGISHGANLVTVSSVTIGGISATQAPGALQTGSFIATDIWYAAVPTGTTATIVINYSASETRMALVVYSVVGTSSAFSAAGGQGLTGGGIASLTATLSTPVGGGAIAFVQVHNAGAQTFSGTNLTVDIPSGIVVGSSNNSSAHDTTHSGSTAYTMSWTTPESDAAMSVATFSP